ncbi:hypothetical protein AHAS_Ahas03G0169500 [Arachis hypogaea]
MYQYAVLARVTTEKRMSMIKAREESEKSRAENKDIVLDGQTLEEANENLDEVVVLAKDLLYEKHYPPYLNDDIWRLKKIAKDGKIHKRLSSHGIHTVKDLLQLYTTEPFSLYVRMSCLHVTSRSRVQAVETATDIIIRRRESTYVEDLFIVHIVGMDTMACGFKNAAKLIEVSIEHHSQPLT